MRPQKTRHHIPPPWAGLLLLILLPLCLSPVAATQVPPRERRVALLIGNGQYRHTRPLTNPVPDVTALAAKLKDLRFDVQVGKDQTKTEMEASLREFSQRVEQSDIALFFFAGHGAQARGENYLYPIDAKHQGERELSLVTIRVSQILDILQDQARAGIIILDACRDNPLANEMVGSSRSRTTGFAEIQQNTADIKIVYATQPNSVAEDGKGQPHSPFTAALLQHLGDTGVEFDVMLKRVTAAVRQQTQGRQSPWQHGSVVREIYLAPNPPPPPPQPTPPPTPPPLAPAQPERPFRINPLLLGTSRPPWWTLTPADGLTGGLGDLPTPRSPAPPPPPRGFCYLDNWCWQNPLPQGQTLSRIWGTSPTDVWVTTHNPDVFVSSERVLHWDGKTWSESNEYFGRAMDIWGSGPNEVRILSYSYVHHWNGVTWRNTKVLDKGILNAQWGSWAVGDAGVIMHWDGARWTPFKSPRKVDLHRIWGSGPSDVWAVGDKGAVLRWDGRRWTEVTDHGLPAEPRLVWGIGSSDTWLIASNGEIRRWDGARFAGHASPGQAIKRLWGARADDVWAVTDEGNLLHFDGKAWKASPTLGRLCINDVWGSGPKDVWTVGCGGMVQRWNGERWAIQHHRDAASFADLWGMWGSGPEDLWAFGEQGLLHREDGRWTAAGHPGGAALRAAWGSGPKDIWTVGENGTILRWNGSSWALSRSGGGASLRAIWGSGPGDIWAAGGQGILLHWDGRAWTQAPSPVSTTIQTLWGAAPADFWAGAEEGVMLHWNGARWATVDTPKQNALLSIWGSKPADVWAIGTRYILRWNGSAWTVQQDWPKTLDSQGVYGWNYGAIRASLWGSGPNDVWALFSEWPTRFLVQRWDGVQWSRVISSAGPMTGIWGLPPAPAGEKLRLWLFGPAGKIIGFQPSL